ncbi:MAG: polyprenyl synthetase family protein [Legionella sp.]|nr:polyprenyl synthetase family protein [Legionella sp.]
MNNDKIIQYLAHHENILHEALKNTDIPAKRIKDAMNYALFPAGKRLRPILVYLCGEILEIKPECLGIIAAAIELTHCYSLVHDDLPAMDNDDYRRGRLSCHRAFDEATAILVGDGMQALAIELLLTELPKFLSAEQVIVITRELVNASGPAGMVSGQSLDLSELSKPYLKEKELRTIHSLKTGKLIAACINTVLAASSFRDTKKDALRDYARHFGLVFQMQDDYLDKYAAADILGKGRASDSANKKITFANLYDQATLSELITRHFQLAKDALKPFEDKAHDLLAFTDHLQQRSHLPAEKTV